MSNATQLLHSIPVDPLTGAISVPIYQNSTFIQEAPGINKGYDYADIRRSNGVCDSLIRLSVGLEEVEDFEQAFDKTAATIHCKKETYLSINQL